MAFTRTALNAHNTMVSFCQGLCDPSQLTHDIAQLTQDDLLSVDSFQETLFYKAISLSAFYDDLKCAHIMSLLAFHAQFFSTDIFNAVVFLLKRPNAARQSPLQKILMLGHTSVSTTKPNDTHAVVDMFIKLCEIQLGLGLLTPARLFDLYDLCGENFYWLFMYKQTTVRNYFLSKIHQALSNQWLDIAVYQELFLKPVSRGVRILDRLIIYGTIDNLKSFFTELRILRLHGSLSQNQYDEVLTSHARLDQGFSPLHEVIRTNDYAKIVFYVNEIRAQASPAAYKNALSKTNEHGYTALQQGINNGLTEASLAVSRYFLELIQKPPYTLDEALAILSCNGKHRMRCLNSKIGSRAINDSIKQLKLELRAQRMEQNDRELKAQAESFESFLQDLARHAIRPETRIARSVVSKYSIFGNSSASMVDYILFPDAQEDESKTEALARTT